MLGPFGIQTLLAPLQLLPSRKDWRSAGKRAIVIVDLATVVAEQPPKKTAMIRLAEKPHCLPPTSFQSCHRSQAWSLSKREVGCGWLHMGMLNAEQLFFMTSGMLLNRTDSYGSSSMCPCTIYPPPPSVVACATPATHTLHMQISQICQDQHCPTSSAGEVPIPRLFT